MPEPQSPRSDVTLREATERDWPLLRAWLQRKDVQRWWGSAGSAEAEIRTVFETSSAIGRIVVCDGNPVGYAHAIDATYWGETLPEGIPAGAWDVDIVIADPAHRGRGIGQAALEALADEVFSTTLAVALCVFVSVRNEPAVRAYERAGFKWKCVWDDPEFGASWMMLRERQPGDGAGKHAAGRQSRLL